MSTGGSRVGTRGGRGTKTETNTKSQKTASKSETAKAPDVNPKTLPTPDQIRIAQITQSQSEDPDLRDKIKLVMDATQKSEDEVCTALHDCDNDAGRAVNMLLEGNGQGEWETSHKKKKPRQPGGTGKTEQSVPNNRESHNEGNTHEGRERERPQRTRGGAPPRMRGRGGGDNRRWQARENKENERNLEESWDKEGGRSERGERDREGGQRRGGRMSNGPGGGRGRGGRGGRLGPRTFQNRDKTTFSKPIETWNNPQTEEGGDTNKGENWDNDFPSPEDWDNEEYTGSLADTKVFTPTSSASAQDAHTPTMVPVSALEPLQDATNQDGKLSTVDVIDLSCEGSVPDSGVSLDLGPSFAKPTPQSHSAQVTVPQLMTAAQSQYLGQFAQASENLKAQLGLTTSSSVSSVHPQQPNTNPVSYQPTAYTSAGTASTYSNSSSYGNVVASYSSHVKSATTPTQPSSNSVQQQQQQQQLPARTKTQKTRLPTTSKIPSSAVEMPGESINSGMSFLDVQFGGLDLGSDTESYSFGTNNSSGTAVAGDTTGSASSKYSGNTVASVGTTNSTSNDLMSQSQQVSSPAGVSVTTSVTGSGSVQSTMDISSGGQTTVKGSTVPVQDGYRVSQTSQSVSSKDLSQSALSSSLTQGQKASEVNKYSSTRNTTNSTALDLSKTDSTMPGFTSSSSSNSGYPSSYSGQKASSTGYQQVYSAQGYGATQVQSTTSSYPSNQTQNTVYSTQSNSSYASQAPPAHSTYSGSNQSASSSYAGSSQPTSQSNSSYQTVPNAYQSGNQSVAAYQNASQSTAAYQNTNQQTYGASTVYSAGVQQYQGGYGSTQVSHSSAKINPSLGSTKDSQYDSSAPVSSAASSTPLATSVNASTALGLSATSQSTSTTPASSVTKAMSSAGKAGVVPNVPPGVPPMMGTHQYILSQTGIAPYFPGVQQPVYGYEEVQMLQQQRFSHMPTAGYCDVGFQAPTSLATASTARDVSLGSIAYTASDGRFTRTDNSSPVPSTLSQQVDLGDIYHTASQTHQQPLMNPTTALPPGYAYLYGQAMPSVFQYGTPAFYPMPTATNASGSSQFVKPGSYGSGYGSGFENLAQSPDFGKTAYVTGGTGGQTKSIGGGSNSGGAASSDLGTAMYGKAHGALSKVNSYDKQVFNSGTPPPFSLPGSQTTPLGATSGYPHQLFIPTMAPHQQHHHSTTMMHQPLHQMEMRNPSRRMDTGSTAGQRSQTSSQQGKVGPKQAYSTSYWASN